MSMARLGRAEQAEANRRAVLDAARRQFEQNGFHGASLDVIADEAGFSKGAVYSRFASKDDLFLAVIEDRIGRRAAVTAEQLDELDQESIDLVDLARLSIGASVASVAWQAALMEFRAHAFRNPDLNDRYRDLHQRTVRSIAALVAELYDRRGEEVPVPVEQMARVALAVGTGIVAEFMADPDLDVGQLIELSVAAMDARPIGLANPGAST